MNEPFTVSPLSFAYRGQDHLGDPVSGSIDAPDLDGATKKLHSLGLRILSIEPTQPPSTNRPLKSADFLAFNEQLAQLTTAGLPVEHGLKLIAQDLHGGRLAATVRAIADELDRGTSLPDALAQNHKQFPPLYARLVEAGVKSNSLSGLLFNLAVHLEMVRRLRAAIWRTIAYPLMVLLGLAIVLLFLSQVVFPQFAMMFQTYQPNSPIWIGRFFHSPTMPSIPDMPIITQVLFAIGSVTPYIAIIFFALIIIIPPLWRSQYHASSGVVERLTLRLPLVGSILRKSMLARWCDIARLGVSVGLDLPASIQLASDAIASPSLARDSGSLINDLEAGRPFDVDDRRIILPRVVPAAIELASRTNNLPGALASLSDVYRRQAESQLDNLPTILSPILLLVMALSIGFVIVGLMLPVLNYIRYISGVF